MFLPKRTSELTAEQSSDVENIENKPEKQLIERLHSLKIHKSVGSLRKSSSKWQPKRTSEIRQELIEEDEPPRPVSDCTVLSRLQQQSREVFGLLNGERNTRVHTHESHNIEESIYEKLDELDGVFPLKDSLILHEVSDNGEALRNALNGNFTEFSLKINGNAFTVNEILGKGGTSVVFSSHDELDTNVAIKVTDIGEDAEKIASFNREVALLMKLQNQKHIVNILQNDIQNDFAMIVLEKGTCDLYKHLLTYTSDIPLPKIGLWFHDMIVSVRTIHDKFGIIHADLKPSNFLLMPDGRLKLTDFGISQMKQQLSDVTAAASTDAPEIILAGTMNFLCPEAVNALMNKSAPSITEASDIWSLGVIFYYLLYKELPFGRITDKRKKMLAIASATSQLNFGPLATFYPEMLRELCKACLQFQPEKRPAAKSILNLFPLEMIVEITE